MTPIRKPVTRVSPVTVRDGGKRRQLVVTLYPEFVELRMLGTRRAETIGLEGAYFGAIKARVFKEKMDKAKDRKAKAEARKKR